MRKGASPHPQNSLNPNDPFLGILIGFLVGKKSKFKPLFNLAAKFGGVKESGVVVGVENFDGVFPLGGFGSTKVPDTIFIHQDVAPLPGCNRDDFLA